MELNPRETTLLRNNGRIFWNTTVGDFDAQTGHRIPRVEGNVTQIIDLATVVNNSISKPQLLDASYWFAVISSAVPNQIRMVANTRGTIEEVLSYPITDISDLFVPARYNPESDQLIEDVSGDLGFIFNPQTLNRLQVLEELQMYFEEYGHGMHEIEEGMVTTFTFENTTTPMTEEYISNEVINRVGDFELAYSFSEEIPFYITPHGNFDAQSGRLVAITGEIFLIERLRNILPNLTSKPMFVQVGNQVAVMCFNSEDSEGEIISQHVNQFSLDNYVVDYGNIMIPEAIREVEPNTRQYYLEDLVTDLEFFSHEMIDALRSSMDNRSPLGNYIGVTPISNDIVSFTPRFTNISNPIWQNYILEHNIPASIARSIPNTISSNISPPPTLLREQTNLREQSYDTLLKQLYGLPVEIPNNFVIEGVRIDVIPFSDLTNYIPMVVSTNIDPQLQPWAGPPGTSYRMVTLHLNDGTSKIVKGPHRGREDQIFEH